MMEHRRRDRLSQSSAADTSISTSEKEDRPRKASGANRIFSWTSILAVLVLGLAVSQWLRSTPVELPPLIRGKDNTVLFLAHAESGQINVQLATVQALAQAHPEIDIHIASFSTAAKHVERASAFALAKTSSGRGIKFHELPGPDRSAAIMRRLGCDGRSVDDCISHRPGAAGIASLVSQLEVAVISWNGTEHYAIYQEVIRLVDEIDPAVVVLDYLHRPGVDAIRHLNRAHVIITPNALSDVVTFIQDYGAGLWKYPALGTGFTFPVPWHRIPENLYVNLRFIYSAIFKPLSRDVMSYLRSKGVKPIELFDLRPDALFISQTLPEASLPVTNVPANVTAVGALLLDSAPAAQQDAGLVKWLQKPTVVVNLGSLFTYSEERAITMAAAIGWLLDHTDFQVLWKMAPHNDFGDAYAAPLQEFVKQERLKISHWLPIDTLGLLEAGNVVAFIHHGGASSYHEAVVAGVPQVVIPMWEDLYNFAQLAEDLGIGVYACRRTAPAWTVEDLVDAFGKVVMETEASLKMRETAHRIGVISRKRPGREVAAELIAEMVVPQ
ncbi:hypothetical protein PFICI_06668 [Pestalotiopsis fici W106-1]|uniref:Erythromycin biosynthesis protein CIII-like C-terminal domain-containing protein n=1 Tax=Pestalotiopsis fici (strain W106-1 / CGMCC3.15140) TaxID=1229662 RepID=W3X917_PESFW|nr:uncharacterized protein PFICI_06668 [Pestalotiopsis fici W106-1]ETS81666.1 hypothetical protein PFICI_06668 [Pestalotiopsis fici W106-1]